MSTLYSMLNSSSQQTTSTASETNIAVASETPMVINETETWTVHPDYAWYDDFADDKYSTVDVLKNIKLDANQVNLSQEELSQYIPFEMPRRYDNFDMTTTKIQFHYVNPDGFEDYVTAVNVQYSETKIRFALLVPLNMTALAGKVEFEIVAFGLNSKNENYKWISRSTVANVIKSLSGNGIVDPTTSDWYTTFVNSMNEKVRTAQEAATNAETYANELREKIDSFEADIDTQVKTTVAGELGNYYTKEEDDATTATLRDEISAVDDKVDAVSERTTILEDTVKNFDGLASFNAEFVDESDTLVFYNGEEVMKEVQLNMTPSQEYTEGIKASYASADEALKTDILAEVDKKIDAVDISDELSQLEQTIADTYYNKEQTDGLLTDKADNTTVTGLTTRVGAVEAKVNTLETNSDAVTQKLTEIEEKINNANTDPTVRYRTSYDGTTGTFNLIEVTENEAGEEVETIVSTHIIVGGSGGSSSSTSITIDRISPSPLVVVSGDKAIIKYKYTSVDSSGDDTGEGTATWKVGSTTVATSMALQGDNEFDITPYVTTGTQKVTLTIVDTSGSLLTKYWTVQIVDVRLESTFNDKYTYPLGEIAFSYIPYGSIEKTIHFILDGEELDSVVTTASGVPMNYTLPAQEHGSHLLETYITAEVNGSTIETDHIFKDIFMV